MERYRQHRWCGGPGVSLVARYDLPILPDLPGLGSGESSYGSAPYAESAARAQARLGLRDRLLAGLAGLGQVQPGMNFGQSFLAAAGGSARATWAAKQAAMNYAQRQVDQEIQRQNAETQRLLAEGKDSRPWYYQEQYADLPEAKALRAGDVAKVTPKPEKTFQERVAEAEAGAGRKLTDAEVAKIGGYYVEPKKPEETGKPKLGDYDKMSDNFRNEPTVKDYNTVRDSYRRIESSARLSSGFGDLAMIFSYMKVLDPGSTVREGEFANAQQAMGQLQKMTNVPRQWWSGTRLTPAGRAGLLSAARELRDAQKGTYEATVNRYKATAKKYGIDWKDFITEYNDNPSPTSTADDPLGILK